MDVGNDFIQSFHSLWKNKVIVLPNFISSALFIIAAFAFLLYSGVLEDYVTYTKLQEEYIRENPGFIGKANEKTFESYLQSRGFAWDTLRSFVNIRNAVIVVLSVLLLIAVSFYMRTATLALISLVVNKRKLAFGAMTSLANKLVFRFFWLHVLIILLFIAPLIVAVIAIVLSFILAKWIGAIIMVLFIIGFIVYAIYIAIKIVFSAPIAFIDDKSAFQSIKHSYAITKGRFLDALLIAIIFTAVVVGFSMLFNSLMNFLPLMVLSNSALMLFVAFFIILVFYFLNSIVDAFAHLFLFYSYVDFVSDFKSVKKQKMRLD